MQQNKFVTTAMTSQLTMMMLRVRRVVAHYLSCCDNKRYKTGCCCICQLQLARLDFFGQANLLCPAVSHYFQCFEGVHALAAAAAYFEEHYYYSMSFAAYFLTKMSRSGSRERVRESSSSRFLNQKIISQFFLSERTTPFVWHFYVNVIILFFFKKFRPFLLFILHFIDSTTGLHTYVTSCIDRRCS